MKKLILIVVTFVGCLQLNAQQDPHFAQFFDNMLFVNPAYAGSRDVLNVTGIHREQWVGFAGRPSSTTLSLHSPLSYRSIGLGITVVDDKVGPFKQNMFYGDFSYSIKFKNKSKLAFGLKGGLNLINIGTGNLNVNDNTDQAFSQSVSNLVNPNFGFGVYYHSSKFFIGASTPKLLEKSYDGTVTNLEKRHYFFNVGGVIPVNRILKLRPIVQTKLTVGAPVSIDASCAAIVREKLYLGAIYRLDAAFGAYVQYQIAPSFRFGFATEFGTQEIRQYNSGTFEVMASYELVFRKDGVRSPRFF